jgi:O-acetyl-ADP-ribose deacetylase (regulator of RNase III)
MIRYIKGNLLDANVEAFVNTVNTVGVMGKGIALQFKDAFPNNFSAYEKACKSKWLEPGKLLVVREPVFEGEKIIINFPTKTEWFQKSKYEYIEKGLAELVSVIKKEHIKSIAIPPMGCGNGGLKWEKVKPLMIQYLSALNNVEIIIYEPDEAIKELLKKQSSNKDVKLTVARAMLLYSMFYYESLGENSSLFVANKLAYFLQRLGEKSFSKLKFEASHYGPYSVGVEHVLHTLNGKYLKGLEQMNAKAFEPLELQYDKASEVSMFIKKELLPEQVNTIKNLTILIDGFQSALSLEILASVDFIRKNNPGIGKEDILKTIQNWSTRKSKLFGEKYISIALNHLQDYEAKLLI